MVTTTQNPDGFYIGVGCPGCGGRVQLQSDFFVAVCAHCGSTLRILRPDQPVAYVVNNTFAKHELRFHLDRYLKQHDLPLTDSRLQTKSLLVPFWRIDGTLLKVRNRTEKHVVLAQGEVGATTETVDYRDRRTVALTPYTVTIAASKTLREAPGSLGLRSETAEVTPLSTDNLPDGFELLPVTESPEALQGRLDKMVEALGDIDPADFGKNSTRLFHAQWSLIYFPFIVAEVYTDGYHRMLVDGVTGRVVADREPQGDSGPVAQEPSSGDAVAECGRLEIEFHRCRNCGSDLPAEQSHLYLCHNCGEPEYMGASRASIGEISVVLAESNADDLLVPFWCFHLAEQEQTKFTRLLGATERLEHLLVPAINTQNFEAVYRLAKRMTSAWTKLITEPVTEPDVRSLPIQISRSEAEAVAEMIWCHLCLDKEQSTGESIDLSAAEAGSLCYVPFRLEQYFYVDRALEAVSVERSLVESARD